MFDSPFDLCPRCGEAVLLDQTQTECMGEHGCDHKAAADCPLQKFFTGIDFKAPHASALVMEKANP